MASLDRHPDRVISPPLRQRSCWAYQFMPIPGRWYGAVWRAGFRPDKDQGHCLIPRRKAHPLADSGAMTRQLAALLAPGGHRSHLAGCELLRAAGQRFDRLRSLQRSLARCVGA